MAKANQCDNLPGKTYTHKNAARKVFPFFIPKDGFFSIAHGANNIETPNIFCKNSGRRVELFIALGTITLNEFRSSLNMRLP